MVNGQLLLVEVGLEMGQRVEVGVELVWEGVAEMSLLTEWGQQDTFESHSSTLNSKVHSSKEQGSGMASLKGLWSHLRADLMVWAT